MTGVWKTLSMDVLDQLQEVQRNGAVAQVRQAEQLLTLIAAEPDSPSLRVEATILYDAYLNDPYLTRNTKS
jgi:hypothetical protein